MIRIYNNKLKEIPLDILFVFAPFAVFSMFQNLTPIIPTTVLIQLFTLLHVIIVLIKQKKVILNTLEINIILLFVLPIIFSFFGILIYLLMNKDAVYLKYINDNLLNRVFLIITNILLLIGALSITKNWTKEQIFNLVKKYYIGLMIFIIVGVWQFLHFKFNVPFISIKTRDYIHSISSSTFYINNRLTSLANEPSYLAPLAIDFIIISFILYKKPYKQFIMGLFVLIFSYSGGGYLNIVILAIIFIVIYPKYKGHRYNKTYYIIGLLVTSVTILIIIYKRNDIFNILYPVIGRMDSIFSIKEHIRMFMIVMPFLWAFDGTIFNVIFGHGPNSFNYLHLIKELPTGQAVHVTSNNLFSDTVYELGYLGLVCYIIIFLKLILSSLKNIKANKYYFTSLMLSCHLILSSIYRADFMQPRFWVIIFIILKLISLGNFTYEMRLCDDNKNFNNSPSI